MFRPRPIPSGALRAGLPAIAAGALLAPICLVYLWFPGDADEVLFELGARRLAAGEVIYRDFWDIKQPGIYWFYQAGLSLGLGVVGPRLLELAAVSVGGWLVWRLAGRWQVHRVVQVLAPALVVGGYLLLTHRGGVAEIEGLTNPLLVAVVAAAWPARPGGGQARSPVRWVLAGVAAGLVGVLKILYLPIPAVLLLGALAASRTSASGRIGRAVAAGCGALIPLGAATWYFAAHGLLRLAWVTTVQIPLRAAGGGQLGDGRYRWLELLIGLSGLIAPLAVVALATARRRGTLVREGTLAAAVLVALVLAWPQYPTPYRLLVLVAPLGLLAVVGADVVWRWSERAAAGVPGRLRRRRVIALALTTLLALPMLRGPERLLVTAGRVPSWGLGQDARNARDFVLTDEHPDQDVAPVRSQIRPGSAIFVLGHPQPYQLLGAREAVEISGWSVTLMPDPVWAELDRELARSRPEWVFVENDDLADLPRRLPRMLGLLAGQYQRVADVPRGVWYRTTTPGAPSGTPGDNRL
jgi:hypothetical protein